MDIVLLGATGFVGSAVLRALRPGRVHALVRDPRRVPPAPAGVSLRVVQGDVQDPPLDLLPARPHVVIHFATRQIDSDGTGFEAVNVQGTRRLVGLWNDGTQAVLYGSSVSVYGQGAQWEADENTPIRPLTALACSRARAEETILEAAAQRRIGAYCLRPRFIFGRGDRHTLPGLVRMVRAGIQPGRGTQCYSIIDVDDYAHIVLALAERLRQPGFQEQAALHVGYELPVSMAEIVALICREFDLVPPRFSIPVRPWMAQVLRRAPARAAHTLATRLELFGLSHTLSVERLRARIGSRILSRHPLSALETAAAYQQLRFGALTDQGATCYS